MVEMDGWFGAARGLVGRWAVGVGRGRRFGFGARPAGSGPVTATASPSRPLTGRSRLGVVLLSLMVSAGVLVGLSGVGLVSAGAVPCGQWDITGAWATTQSNVSSVPFNFQQSGKAVTGTGSSPSDGSGTLTGTLNGDQLDFVVNWSDGLQGHYVATITQGALTGTTTGGGQTASWTGTGPTRCTDTTTTSSSTTTTVAATTTTTVPATTTTTRPATTTTTRPGFRPPPVNQPPPTPCFHGTMTCSLSQTHLIIAVAPALSSGLPVLKPIDVPLSARTCRALLASAPSLSSGLPSFKIQPHPGGTCDLIASAPALSGGLPTLKPIDIPLGPGQADLLAVAPGLSSGLPV